MKQRLIWQGFLASLVLALAASGSARAALAPQEQRLIPGAKKEGEVLILSATMVDSTAVKLRAAFIKRYGLGDGFRVNVLRKGTGAIVSTMRQEIQAGKITSDVPIVSAPAFFDAAARAGHFLPLDSAYWKDHVELIEKAGQYARHPHVVVPFAYTFQPVWNTTCPGMQGVNIQSYADVVKPEYKGKMIVTDLTKSITHTNTAIALRESGFDIVGLWGKLKGLDSLPLFRNEVKMQKVLSCERPIELWGIAGRIYLNALIKPELARTLRVGTYKEGLLMLGNQAAVPKGAPHPNAGKLMIEFMLSQEGTDIIVGEEAVYTFRKDYRPPEAVRPYLLDLNQQKLLKLKDWLGNQKEVKRIRDEWVNVFK